MTDHSNSSYFQVTLKNFGAEPETIQIPVANAQQYVSHSSPLSNNAMDILTRRLPKFSVTALHDQDDLNATPHFEIFIDEPKTNDNGNLTSTLLHNTKSSPFFKQTESLKEQSPALELEGCFDVQTIHLRNAVVKLLEDGSSGKQVVQSIDASIRTNIAAAYREFKDKEKQQRQEQQALRAELAARNGSESKVQSRPLFKATAASSDGAKRQPRPRRKAKQINSDDRAQSVVIQIKTLEASSTHAFATFLLNGNRAGTLRAINEHPDIDFNVTIAQDTDGNKFFELHYSAIQKDFDIRKIHLAELLLANIRDKWTEGRKVSLSKAREFVNQAINDIKTHYTDKKLGDKIVTLYGKRNSPVTQLRQQNPKVVAADGARAAQGSTTAVNTNGNGLDAAAEHGSMSLEDMLSGDEDNGTLVSPQSSADLAAPALILLDSINDIPTRKFPIPQNYTLAPWQKEDGISFYSMRDAAGDASKIIFTPNQSRYYDALMNPNVRVVMVQAPTGAGKTMIAIRAGLELLKIGAIDQLLYERPTETVGGHYNPYLKGSLDEKMGAYSAVLEEEMQLQLGNGSAKKGKAIFEELKQAHRIDRYDQMYQRGDTLRHSFLIADEVQNKDLVEIFHLISRPGENGKVVLVGDYEDQNDLQYGRISGFKEMFNAFSDPEIIKMATKELKKQGIEINPETVTTIRMDASDIKRSPHTAFVFTVNQLRKQMATAADAPKSTFIRPDPKGRYSQHGDRAGVPMQQVDPT
ncbi:MAG: PhoH family protein [Alphaproteobacteria bacterium]